MKPSCARVYNTKDWQSLPQGFQVLLTGIEVLLAILTARSIELFFFFSPHYSLKFLLVNAVKDCESAGALPAFQF